jgi:hypothetical protein
MAHRRTRTGKALIELFWVIPAVFMLKMVLDAINSEKKGIFVFYITPSVKNENIFQCRRPW